MTPILNQTINSELSQHNDKVYKFTIAKIVAFKTNLQQMLSVCSFNYKYNVFTYYRSLS
jgi:hypothetical protein